MKIPNHEARGHVLVAVAGECGPICSVFAVTSGARMAPAAPAGFRRSGSGGCLHRRQTKRGEGTANRAMRELSCADLMGGGRDRLAGPRVSREVETWSRSATSFYDRRIRATMPTRCPRFRCRPAGHLDIVARVLQLNKFPAGEEGTADRHERAEPDQDRKPASGEIIFDVPPSLFFSPRPLRPQIARPTLSGHFAHAEFCSMRSLAHFSREGR